MTLMSFNSAPHPDNEYHYTKLTIESTTAHVTKIETWKDDKVLYSVPTLGVPIFTIRFDLYDLTLNRMAGISVTYSPDNAGQMEVKKGDLAGSIEYNNVPPDDATVAGAINVRLIFTDQFGPGHYGWLNLDIDYSYPPPYNSDQSRYAWQATLLYPCIDIAKNGTADSDAITFGDYSLLTPSGDKGPMRNLMSGITDMMRVQFAALYKTGVDASSKISYAQGLALMATDARGHHKDLVFTPQAESGELCFKLISPIHLKAKQYVPPVHKSDSRYAFGLSKEDGFGQGFGGASAHFRLYAFRVNAPYAGVPADWRDVANLYRDSVLSLRQGEFFNKAKTRTASGPMDNLSPHTVICNYALDGPIAANVKDKDLPGAWLEVHPVKLNGTTDMRGLNGKGQNPNESLQDALKRILARVNTPDNKVQLEAQLWGFEMGGFYQYYGGFPPITNVLNNKQQRFQLAIAELAAANISLSVTTAPLLPYFNHSRFAGHLRWAGENTTDVTKLANWTEWIQHPFPSEFKRPNSSLSTCALLEVDIVDGDVPIQLKRVFIVKDYPAFSQHPTCTDVEALTGGATGGEQKFNANGLFDASKDSVLANRFYGYQTLALCPTQAVEQRYRDEWLGKVFGCGAKLIEFMLVGWDLGISDVCYNKEHQHIVPAPATEQKLPYDNVIGYGPWAVQRLQKLCLAAHEAAAVSSPSFALTIEGAPVEALLPFVNEFYHSSPLFQYVYAEALLAKMDLGGNPSYVMPGYREQRKLINNKPPPNRVTSIARPAYMIDKPERDRENPPSLKDWLGACKQYFSDYFQVASYGMAPRFYPIGPQAKTGRAPRPNPSNPLAPANPLDATNPPTYTYCRCIQDVFNLRARIFQVGEKAVLGERVMLRDYFFVKSFGHAQAYDYYDYNEELINIMTRAVHMHVQESAYFRGGRMIGKTGVMLATPQAKEKVYAYRADYRTFDDVKPLMATLKARGGPQPKGIMDFLSIGYDKPPGLVSTDRLSHMVWRKQFGINEIGYLYVFGHVGNEELKFQFLYGRGFEKPVWTPTVRWGKIIRVFDGRNHAGCDPSGRAAAVTPTEIKQGDMETAFVNFPLAPRSFAVVEVRVIQDEPKEQRRQRAQPKARARKGTKK